MVEINYKLLGIGIRKRRMALHMTQAELAERTDLSVSYISYLETGKKTPSLACLASIADVLDTTIDTLLTGTLTPSGKDYSLDALLMDCSAQERAFLVDLLLFAKELLQEFSHEVSP